MASPNYGEAGSGIAQSGSGTVGDPYAYTVDSNFVNRPVNHVSFWDACRFVNWLSNGQPTGAQDAGTTERGTYTLDGYNGTDGRTIQRNANATWALTSEDEWYKAAYYDPTTGTYFDYPTSTNTVPGRDMADALGNNANWHLYSGTYPIDSPYYTTVAGEFQNSASPYGTFDQGGNLFEMNEAVIYGSYRGLRGGAYDGPNDWLHAMNRANPPWYCLPTFEVHNEGFRVSQVIPEPVTMAMVGMGIAGLGGYIRRRMAR